MLRRTSRLYVTVLALVGLALDGAQSQAHALTLTAEQVVAKNVAARGGLQAWRAVQTLTLSGQMQAGGTQNTELPFVLEMKRPRKSRLELKFAGRTGVQVYDGVQGWKLRPYLGRNDVESFTGEELKEAALQSELDGPLIDYAAKGSKVALEGIEKLGDREAYRLKVTTKSGHASHVWLDAQTFLEVKVEGVPRRLDGKLHGVEIAYKNYRSVHGLMIPHLLETTVHEAARIPGKGMKLQDVTSKIVIDNVVWNRQLADSRFTKPPADQAPKGERAPKPEQARKVSRSVS